MLALGKLFSEFLIPNTCCDVPSSLFSFFSLQWQLRKGALPLSQACGGPHEDGGHALCYDKASLNGLWPLFVPGLCLMFSLTHQVTIRKSLGFLVPISAAIKFLWFTLPTNPPRRP